jgi:transcription elongation factor Elf1
MSVKGNAKDKLVCPRCKCEYGTSAEDELGDAGKPKSTLQCGNCDEYFEVTRVSTDEVEIHEAPSPYDEPDWSPSADEKFRY